LRGLQEIHLFFSSEKAVIFRVTTDFLPVFAAGGRDLEDLAVT
jgi:hypothetical protein